MSICILPKVESQINGYLSSQNTQALAESSQRLYRVILTGKLLRFCRLRGIEEIDKSFVEHMDDLVKYLERSGLSAHSLQHYLTVIKFFARTMDIELKYTYKIPRSAKQAFDLKHQQRWFSDRDIAMCRTYRFRKNHLRSHVLVRLFIETGARVDEIAHIKCGNVDIDNETIFLTHSKTVSRQVFFSQETAIYMGKFFKARFPDPVAAAGNDIFPGKNRIYKIVIEMLNDLGLKRKGDGRGPHTFRHYTATYLHYTLGMELTHVAALLGDTPETISSRYLHPTAQMLQSKIKKASGWS